MDVSLSLNGDRGPRRIKIPPRQDTAGLGSGDDELFSEYTITLN